MTPDSLLGPLNDLPPRAVTAHLRELARTLPEDARVSLTAELLGGSHRARELGVQFALIAGDTAAILGALRQGSPLIRESAASALGRVPMPAPEQLIEAYAGASARERQRLVRGIVAHRRGDLATVLLPESLALGYDADAARLLRAAGYRDLAAHAADLLPAIDDARFLAVRVPELLLAEARTVLPGHTAADGYWLRRGDALAELVRSHPVLAAEVLALVVAHPPEHGWRHDHAALWNALLIAVPDALAAYAAQSVVPELSRTAVRAVLERGGADVVALLSGDRAGRAFRTGDPARLRALLATVPARPGAAPEWARERVLPEAVRITEAEAAIAAHVGPVPPHVTARLGWPRARTVLLELARGRDLQVRATAAPAAIASTVFDASGEELADALAELPRVRTEAETVRVAVIGALADLPAGRVATLPLKTLTDLREDALAARDHSEYTARALIRLAVHLVRSDRRDWALETLATVDPGGYLGPVDALTGTDAAAAADALLSGGFVPAIRIVGEFGMTPAIEAHAGAALIDEHSAEDADDLAEIWLARAATRGERVQGLIADPSALQLDAVDRLVRGARSELLDPSLLGTDLDGRFVWAPERWMPRITQVRSWSEDQRRAAAERLGAVLAEDPTDERALEALAAIPEYRHRPLAAIAEIDEASAERVMAVGATPNPVLSAALRTDAAATAGFAVIRRAARTRAGDVAALIDAMLTGPAPRLTGAKALLRAAEYATRAEVPGLRARILDAVGGHPDVALAGLRIALARPAEAIEQAWALMPADPDAAALLRGVVPARLDAATTQDYAGLIADLIAGDEPLVAARAVTASVAWIAAHPAIRAQLWARVVDPAQPELPDAVWARLLVCADGADVTDAVRTLIAAGASAYSRLLGIGENRVWESARIAEGTALLVAEMLAGAGFYAAATTLLLRRGGAVDIDIAVLSVAVRHALGERVSVAASVLSTRLEEYPRPEAATRTRLVRLAHTLERTGTAESILALEIARLVRVADPRSPEAEALFSAGLDSANAEVREWAIRFGDQLRGTR